MKLTDLLGTELPLIQAPMAGVQNSALALAVDESAAAEEGDASPVTSADGSLRHWRMHAPAATRSP